MAQKIKLSSVRLAFTSSQHSSIWEPIADDSGTDKFGCTVIVETGSENHEKIVAAMKAACKDGWGDKAQAMWKQLESGNKLCLRDGNQKPDTAGLGDGVHFMTASSRNRPTLLNGQKQPTVQSDGLLASGNYANAILEIYPLTKGKGAPRICCSLGGLMFSKRGEALGGSAPVKADEFGDFEDGEDGEDDNAADF